MFFAPIAAPLVAVLLAGTAQEKAAQTAAESWLKLVDDAKYEQSWDEAAKLFKAALKKEQWAQAVGAARGPLGALVSRKLKSAQLTTTLPGAPDGNYVVLQFDTVFRNKAQAVETVTPMLEADGTWHVSGYFVR